VYAEERRAEIVVRARRDGRVEVTGLAAEFAVTPETVRRDLTDLEQRGVLRRVHGGAIPADRLRVEHAVSERAVLHTDEKSRIATAALAELPDTGGTVLIDAGTTTGALAAALPEGRELTVVTNAAPIALALVDRAGVEVLLVGGRVRARTLATVDDWALRTLDELSVDVAFVAANGVSVDRGLTTPDPAEAAIKRAMIRTGRRVVLLADRSKVGDDHFVRFGTLDELDLLITDDGLDPRQHADLTAAGLQVVLA
jgi:DeoR family transcriptional regulator, fructose operon transcriptional repressor